MEQFWVAMLMIMKTMMFTSLRVSLNIFHGTMVRSPKEVLQKSAASLQQKKVDFILSRIFSSFVPFWFYDLKQARLFVL